ncbi:MAG TPA: PhzF family phenazine biosynthesis protein [Anaerolineae bacterium]|nr:PhzF family phenazine biosynthesis protein [Anaerolineae bacterium]
MPSYPFMQVDAFTDRPLGGNPCAILFDCSDLSAETMLAVAREMNLSETAFVWEKPDGHFRARYFTPAEEIPLAGHPTIATVFALVETGRLKVDSYLKIPLELRDGPIDVEIFAKSGKVERVVMSQRKPQFLRIYSPEEALPAFGLSPADLLPGACIQTVSTGTPQLFIPLNGLDALRRAQVDMQKFSELRRNGDFFSVHPFCLQGIERGQTFARHFALLPDIAEDPFTGSATGGMAAYLWHYGLLASPSFLAEQGHWMQRPGIGFVEVVGPREAIETVKVGGGAVVVLRGELSL